MDPVWKRPLQQIWSRWWIVLLITALGVGLAVLSSVRTPTTYVGKSTLVVSSPGMMTEQDAVLVRGYLELFNDPATMDRLRAKQQIPSGVTLEAKTAAASPILVIEATADSSQAAQKAALEMAEAFRDDINSARASGTKKAAAELQAQLDELRARPGPPDGSVDPGIGQLQDRIDTMRFDSTSQLQVLQSQAGVAENKPNLLSNVLLGAAGGLVLGLLAALGLAAMSTRIRGAADMRERAGMDPLVEIPDGGSAKRDGLREDRIRRLSNIVCLEKLPIPTVLALTDTRDVYGASELAQALARLFSNQGRRTVLVHADNADRSGSPGFNDALSSDRRLIAALLQDSHGSPMKILRAGGAVTDRYALLRHERTSAIFGQLRSLADMIVVVTPAITDAEAEILCALADCTILVANSRTSRAADLTAAAETLGKAHASLLGTVLVAWKERPKARDGGRRRSDGAGNHGRTAAPPVRVVDVKTAP